MIRRPAARLRAAICRLLSTDVQPAVSVSPERVGPEPAAPQPGAVAPLMDGHGRLHDYLRISLTERCNLRCQYCMPAEGVPLCPAAALLAGPELARLARVFAALGVRKVRLTGGEPTLRRDLPEIIQSLKSIPGIETVGVTTNALVLTRALPALRRAGLDALNVSLDTLRPDRYLHMARRNGLSRVLAAIDLALQLDYRPLKINTVLMKGFNDDEICDFVEFTRDREVEVHRVHAVQRQRVAAGPPGAVPYRAASHRRAVPRPARSDSEAKRHRTGVPSGGSRGPRGVHLVHDARLLLLLQPTPAHRRREPQGVSVRVGGGVAAGRAARGGRGRGAGDSYQTSSHEQEAATRWHAEPQRYEKPAYDFNRWLASPPLPAPPALLRPPAAVTSRRAYSSLSHVDGAGRARMVDVAHKPSTERAARAECALHVAAPVLALLRARRVAKGDALAVAEVAGVLAAKRTADLIPLCHSLALSSVRVWVSLPPAGDAAGCAGDAGGGALRVVCEARAGGRTGVEMEALTGAALAALTLYDMCKAADPRMRITDLRVTRKQGGKRDFEEHENEQCGGQDNEPSQSNKSDGPSKTSEPPKSEDPPKPSGPPKSGDPPKSSGPPKNSGGPPKSSGPPADPKEPFAPVNFMYF